MSDKKLLPVAAFEWASVARYITYVSSIANLKEINSNHVICFPLARMGPQKLLKQKEAVLLVLESNKKNIERFVGERRTELGCDELAVLRTLYMQYKGNAGVVLEHIDVIHTCLVEIELGILQSQEVDGDDSLF